MKVLAVGGRFDESCGRPSGYIRSLFSELVKQFPNAEIETYNGGNWNTIERLSQSYKHDLTLWFPDVDNQYAKLVNYIKQHNPHTLLVTSKYDRDNDGKLAYSFAELLSRVLLNKANLCLEFKDGIIEQKRRYVARVFDPLGNVFTHDYESDISRVMHCLAARIKQLRQFTRMPSQKIGDAVKYDQINNEDIFFKLVRKYAQRFHELIHTSTQSRMLGNLSFRCMHGFPSVRNHNIIYVSRRNVDKRDIGHAAMVPSCLLCEADQFWVGYYGYDKPSVDSPIQLLLYLRYPQIRYMLHSHVYIKGAPFVGTDAIPCGAIEEFYDTILSKLSTDITYFEANLYGHGSLVMSDSVEKMSDIDYVPRLVPEMITV